MCVSHLIVRWWESASAAVRTMCRRAHLHTIDASPFSRLERRDANQTPSSYRKANGLVLDRPEVEASRRRGRRGSSKCPTGRPEASARCAPTRSAPRSTRRSYFRDEWSTLRRGGSESTATPHAPKEFDIQRGGRARRLVCAPPPFSCLSPVNTEAVGGRICHLAQRTICSRRQPKN